MRKTFKEEEKYWWVIKNNKYAFRYFPLKTFIGKIESIAYDLCEDIASLKTSWEKISKKLIMKRVQWDVPWKTPLRPGRKNIRRNMIWHASMLVFNCLIKNLLWKTCWKTHKRKEYIIHYLMIIKGLYFQEISPLELYKTRSCLIPIPWMHFWNVEFGKDFVNRSARLSHDLVCKISISPFFCNSWG